jgi:hypothetical protein
LATKYRLSIKGIINIFGYKDISHRYGMDQTIPHLKSTKAPASNTRIVVRYIQDGKEKREVLLNYLELKARLIFIRLNQQETKGLNSITSDFLTNHKKYWRTRFKLSTCCAVCGSTDKIENHHIRKLDRKHTKGFGQLLSQLSRKQIPLCRACHNNVHTGKYNDMSLHDLHSVMVAKCENLIKIPNNWDNKAAAPQIRKKLIKWDNKSAYHFNDLNKTMICEYSMALDARRNPSLYPPKPTYCENFTSKIIPLQ